MRIKKFGYTMDCGLWVEIPCSLVDGYQHFGEMLVITYKAT
jgi:hypothetical protein